MNRLYRRGRLTEPLPDGRGGLSASLPCQPERRPQGRSSHGAHLALLACWRARRAWLGFVRHKYAHPPAHHLHSGRVRRRQRQAAGAFRPRGAGGHAGAAGGLPGRRRQAWEAGRHGHFRQATGRIRRDGPDAVLLFLVHQGDDGSGDVAAARGWQLVHERPCMQVHPGVRYAGEGAGADAPPGHIHWRVSEPAIRAHLAAGDGLLCGAVS